jgi:hypothetical protein
MLNGHRSLPAGTCLLTELTRELCQMSSLTDVNVVLPTQRLNLYLSRELALTAGGAAVLPRLWTWDRFIENLIGEYASVKTVMVSAQCELIMEHVLETLSSKSKRPLHTNPRHAHELVHLASELSRSGVRDEAKQRLVAYLENDWRRSGQAFARLSERVLHEIRLGSAARCFTSANSMVV